MRTVNLSFSTAIGKDAVKVCELYTLELQNGETYRYTSFNEDITWDAADNTYSAIPIIRSALSYTNSFEADEVSVMISNIGSDFYDLIQQNILEGVVVTIKRILWNDTYAADKEILLYIGVGDISFDRSIISITCRPDYDRLGIKVPRHTFQEPCNHTLFDVGCGVSRSVYKSSGVATSGTDLTLTDGDLGSIKKVAFDNGDSSNPLEIGMSLEIDDRLPINNFSRDANCKAVYNMEPSNLIVDSKGTNTLANTGVISDAVDYKEGDGSSVYDGNDYMTISDANLDTGFPFKSTDTNGEVSWATWIKIDTLPPFFTRKNIFAKRNIGDFQYNFGFHLFQNVSFQQQIGFSVGVGVGVTYVEIPYATFTPTTGVWYHVAWTYKRSDQSWKMRIWDDTAETVLEVTGTTDTMNQGQVCQLDIGRNGSSYFEGHLDELVFFNDILESAEMDEIRQGLYGEFTPPSGYEYPVITNITYVTNTTGFIWYAFPSDSGRVDFADNDILTEVGAGSADGSVTVNGTPAEDVYSYMYGELHLTSGVNDGQRRQIQSVSLDTFTLTYPLPVAVQAGDTYDVYPGCDKTAITCRDKYDNGDNFKGFLYVPKYEETIM